MSNDRVDSQGNPLNTLENPKQAHGDRKPALHLVPPALSIGAARAFAEGAAKYGAFNWRHTKVRASTYIAGILRHALAYLDGEDLDPESTRGKHHLEGVAASLAILMDAKDGGFLIDDRPPAGPAPKLMRDPKFIEAQQDAEGPYALSEIELALRSALGGIVGPNAEVDAIVDATLRGLLQMQEPVPASPLGPAADRAANFGKVAGDTIATAVQQACTSEVEPPVHGPICDGCVHPVKFHSHTVGCLAGVAGPLDGTDFCPCSEPGPFRVGDSEREIDDYDRARGLKP